ncbi:MAG: GNAT family N-acetyltransferase [Halieaceae bacterium]|jgi:GNAT superfamily N-acetyltransferase|nr:GNAT family N-acetyltransferase [Halieaceae bacterium]
MTRSQNPDTKPHTGGIEAVSLERLYAVYQALPEFERVEPLESLRRRIGERYLAQVYCEAGNDLAFKLGYAIDDEQFYSWLGGVLPEARGRGVARALLRAQEAWALQQGFREMQVKSMNRFPGMLRLLISSGYQITGVTPHSDQRLNKIHFCKLLQN